MGKNYYAVRIEPYLDRAMHLGKQSAGWRFLFRGHDEIQNYEQFVRWLENNVDKEYVLLDEYNQKISKEELLKIIQDNQKIENPDQFNYCRNVNGYRFNNHDFC